MLEKVEGFGDGAVLADELDAVLFGGTGVLKFFDESEALEGKVAIGHEGLADMVAWKFFLFDDENLASFLCEDGCGGGSCRLAPTTMASYCAVAIMAFTGC